MRKAFLIMGALNQQAAVAHLRREEKKRFSSQIAIKKGGKNKILRVSGGG